MGADSKIKRGAKNMRKSKIAIAVFSVIMAATSAAKAEGDTMENLAETSDKISSIDMNKNLGAAGNILDGFYNGSKEKRKSDSSLVYAKQGNIQRAPNLTEKEICNAKSAKIALPGKVPPLEDNSGSSSNTKDAPFGVGVLAAAVVALGLAVRKKGFGSYSEDVHTIWDYIKPGSSSDNTKPPKDPYDPPSSTPSDPFAVHPSGGAVTCIGPSCGLP